jgi:hypothetical protein
VWIWPLATVVAGCIFNLNGLSSAGGGSSYRESIVADRPVAYWRLGDAPGTLVPKNEIGASTGKFLGGLELGQPGAIGNDSDTAVTFNGGHAEIGDQFDFVGDLPISVEVWFQSGAVDGAMLGKQSDTGAGWNFFLWDETADTPVIRFDRLASFNGPRQYCLMRFKEVPGPTAFGDGHYHHAVVTYDTATTRIYLDGVERQNCVQGPVAIPDTTTPLIIGNNYKGGLDEVVLYDTALPPPRVKAHYDAGMAH